MTKRLSYILLSGVLAFVGLYVYYSFNPEISKFFPQCPFHYLTGFDCPGCGSQRAIHYLLHFEIKKAFYRNPLFVLSIPYLITAIYFEYLGGKQKYPSIRKSLFGKKAMFITFCIIVLFWIGRNLLPYLRNHDMIYF